jgi:RND family efflux transporter MFP subunit
LLAAITACRHGTEEQEEPTAVEVHCVPVTRRSIDLSETLPGRVTAPPGGDLSVASQVPGRIDRVVAHEGDRVAAGAVIALVDDTASRDALRQADASVVQAKATSVNAEATLERTRQLVARGIAARQELDDAAARADQARAGVNAAIAAADLAQRTLGRVQVRSALEGVVTRVWRGPGALVDGTAATPIAQLAASTAVEFDADATERQLLAVQQGQKASVVLASGGDPMAGTVRARSTALDPATGLGVIRVAIEPATPLVLGLFGDVRLSLGRRDGAVVVPSQAMRGAVADGAEVVVCKGGLAEVRRVQVGWRDDEQVEIRQGLEPGELLAMDHVLGLQTGAPIVEAR